MPFPTSHLNENEEIVLDLNPHWWYLVKRGALMVAALAFGIFALTKDSTPLNWLAAAVVAVTVVAFLARVIQYSSIHFVVTTERCIYRSGVFAKRGVEIPLDRINTVFFNQGIFERMIRAGDIAIESAGENSRQEFSDILDPHGVQATIYREMEAYENRRQDRLGRVVRGDGPAAGPNLTVAEQLEKLHELRSRGALTDAEYEAEKARLLGG